MASHLSEPGHVVVDFARLPRLGAGDRSYVWSAVDVETGWAYVELQPDLSANSARAFLAAVREHASFRVRTVEAEIPAVDEAVTAGVTQLDEVCAQLGVDYQERRRTPHASTAAEALLSKIAREGERCALTSVAEFSQFLKVFVERHNETLNPNRGTRETPKQALSRWRSERPDLFKWDSARP
ncbi:MAG: hypothetical protein H4O13_18800 [Xanthomonadales bacterium]|nr:hypothetical protein [Xanthomonadales bacterium]